MDMCSKAFTCIHTCIKGSVEKRLSLLEKSFFGKNAEIWETCGKLSGTQHWNIILSGSSKSTLWPAPTLWLAIPIPGIYPRGIKIYRFTKYL